MAEAIATLKKREQENFLKNYIDDIKKTFQKKDLGVVHDEKEADRNFEGSSIQKHDFFVYRVKDFLDSEYKQKSMSIKELVSIKCEPKQEDQSPRNVQNLGYQEKVEKPARDSKKRSLAQGASKSHLIVPSKEK